MEQTCLKDLIFGLQVRKTGMYPRYEPLAAQKEGGEERKKNQNLPATLYLANVAEKEENAA